MLRLFQYLRFYYFLIVKVITLFYDVKKNVYEVLLLLMKTACCSTVSIYTLRYTKQPPFSIETKISWEPTHTMTEMTVATGA